MGEILKMIGCEYKGKTCYISTIEDFREVMEPSVYDALVQSIHTGVIENYKEEYEKLKNDYSELESEFDTLAGMEEEARDYMEQRDRAEQKYDVLRKSISDIVQQLSYGYIKVEDAVHELEQLI